MGIEPLWPTLPPIQCLLYSCCECTWCAPVVQHGMPWKQHLLKRADLLVFTWGNIYSYCVCRRGSCWKHHIPPILRINNLNSFREAWEPPWHLCLGYRTHMWHRCGVPAQQLCLPTWPREARLLTLVGTQHLLEQNWVLHQHGPVHQFVGWIWAWGPPPPQLPAAAHSFPSVWGWKLPNSASCVCPVAAAGVWFGGWAASAACDVEGEMDAQQLRHLHPFGSAATMLQGRCLAVACGWRYLPLARPRSLSLYH